MDYHSNIFSRFKITEIFYPCAYEAVDAQSQRLKRLDETTSDMHLLGENKKLEVAIKKYENERESMMKKVHDYASEYEESYRLIRQTDGKEVHHLDTLKQHNHDIVFSLIDCYTLSSESLGTQSPPGRGWHDMLVL